MVRVPPGCHRAERGARQGQDEQGAGLGVGLDGPGGPRCGSDEAVNRVSELVGGEAVAEVVTDGEEAVEGLVYRSEVSHPTKLST